MGINLNEENYCADILRFRNRFDIKVKVEIKAEPFTLGAVPDYKHWIKFMGNYNI